MKKRVMVYVSAKFQGKKENVKIVEDVIRELIKADKEHDFVFVSPIHCMGWLYEETDYQEGLDWTLELLKRCDAMFVVPGWDEEPVSVGVGQEIELAKKLDIPIHYLEDLFKEE